MPSNSAPFRAFLWYKGGGYGSSLPSLPRLLPSENDGPAKDGLECAGGSVRAETVCAHSFPETTTPSLAGAGRPTLSAIPVDAYVVRYDSPKEVDVTIEWDDAYSASADDGAKSNGTSSPKPPPPSQRESPRRSPRRNSPAALGHADVAQRRRYPTRLPAPGQVGTEPSNQANSVAKRTARPAAQGKGKKVKGTSPLFLLVIRERSGESCSDDALQHGLVANLLRGNKSPHRREDKAGRVLAIYRIFDPNVNNDNGAFDRLGLRNKLAATDQAVQLTMGPTDGCGTSVLWREESLDACASIRSGVDTSACFLQAYIPAKGKARGAAARKRKVADNDAGAERAGLPRLAVTSLQFGSSVEACLFVRSLRAASQITTCLQYGKLAPMIQVDEDSSSDDDEANDVKPPGRAKKQAPIVVLARRVEDGYVIISAKEAAELRKKKRQREPDSVGAGPKSPQSPGPEKKKKSRPDDGTDKTLPPAADNETATEATMSEPLASHEPPKQSPSKVAPKESTSPTLVNAKPVLPSPSAKVEDEPSVLVSNTEQFYFVTPEDRPILTDFMFILCTQVKRGAFAESDRNNVYRKNSNLDDGYLGMRCRHCGGIDAGSYFPTARKNLQGCTQTLHSHLLKCESCPETIKKALKSSKGRHRSQVANMEVTQGVFYSRLWDRIHDATFNGCSDGIGQMVDEFVAGLSKPSAPHPSTGRKEQPSSPKEPEVASSSTNDQPKETSTVASDTPGPKEGKEEGGSCGEENVDKDSSPPCRTTPEGNAGPTADFISSGVVDSTLPADAEMPTSDKGDTSVLTPVVASSAPPNDFASEKEISQSDAKVAAAVVASNASPSADSTNEKVSSATKGVSTLSVIDPSIDLCYRASSPTECLPVARIEEKEKLSREEVSSCSGADHESQSPSPSPSPSQAVAPTTLSAVATTASCAILEHGPAEGQMQQSGDSVKTSPTAEPSQQQTSSAAVTHPTSPDGTCKQVLRDDPNISTLVADVAGSTGGSTDIAPVPEMEMDFGMIFDALNEDTTSQPRLTETMEVDTSAHAAMESNGPKPLNYYQGGASKIGKMLACVASKYGPSAEDDDEENTPSPSISHRSPGKALVEQHDGGGRLTPVRFDGTGMSPIPVSVDGGSGTGMATMDSCPSVEERKFSHLQTPTLTFLDRMSHNLTPFSILKNPVPIANPMSLGSHHQDESPSSIDPSRIFDK